MASHPSTHRQKAPSITSPPWVAPNNQLFFFTSIIGRMGRSKYQAQRKTQPGQKPQKFLKKGCFESRINPMEAGVGSVPLEKQESFAGIL